MAQHGQCRGVNQQLIGRYLAQGLVHRPSALLLANVDIVLDHVALPGLDLQASHHHRLGLVVATQLLQQAGAVVQSVQLQVDWVGAQTIQGRAGIKHLAPAAERLFGPVQVLKLVGQIQSGLGEVRLERQRLAISLDSRIVPAQATEHGAQVEQGNRLVALGLGMGQPDFIELRCRLQLALLLQRAGVRHQLRQADLIGAGAFKRPTLSAYGLGCCFCVG